MIFPIYLWFIEQDVIIRVIKLAIGLVVGYGVAAGVFGLTLYRSCLAPNALP